MVITHPLVFWAKTRRRSPTGSAASGGSPVTARPWQPDAVNVLSDKLVFRPRLTPVAGRDLWHP